MDLESSMEHALSAPDHTVPTMRRPTQPSNCHLLRRLPLELRHAIYAYLNFDAPQYTPFIVRCNKSGLGLSADPDRIGFQNPPVLAWVCRQTRLEVLSLYFGDNVVRVDLDDEITLDAVFLERCLRGLGESLTLIRRFVIRHKVDVFLHETLLERMDAESLWTETLFTVHSDGRVDVECLLKPKWYWINACQCPLSARLRRIETSVPPGTMLCPLSTAIYKFLHLMDRESFDVSEGLCADPGQELERLRRCTEGNFSVADIYTRLYREGHYALDRLRSGKGWPTCEDCGLRQWMLQGPKTDSAKVRYLLSSSFEAKVTEFGTQVNRA